MRGKSEVASRPTMSALLDFYEIDYKQDVQGWQDIRCPFHDDDRPSCRIQTEVGAFFCHACGAAGGSVIAFIMRRQQLDHRAAIEFAQGIPGDRAEPPDRPPTRRRGMSGYVPRYKRRR